MPHSLPFVEQLVRHIRYDDRTECWLWTSHLNNGGYGQVTVQGRPTAAHRWVWMNLRCDIPDGLQIDHLCRVRNCVNPSHLEMVSPRVNTQRGVISRGLDETCHRGHLRTLFSDTSIDAKGHPHRTCRECRRITEWRRKGMRARERRTVCERCGRSVAENNLSRHEAACGRTHCKNGHELTAENTLLNVSRNGFRGRLCRTCERDRSRQSQARTRAKRAIA